MQHSRLIQKQIASVSHAEEEFEVLSSNGGDDAGNNGSTSSTPSACNEIPIVLVPKAPTFIQISATIPSGPFVLWQQWERDMGELSPGRLWFWPAWNRVSHVVTRSPIIYHAPVQDCPTYDNVMVNVEMNMTFRIGPDTQGARTFVYKIGAKRFDELLSVESEEAIRRCIHDTNYDQVSSLRGDIGAKVLSILKEKCKPYGVEMMKVQIINVVLPENLQTQLERITAIKAKIKDSERIHESKVRRLEDEAEKELEIIKKENERSVQEIKAERKRYEFEQRISEEKAKGEVRVQEVEAMTKADVALKKAQGDEVVTKLVARKEAEALLKKTQLECQKLKLEAEQKAILMVKSSEARSKVIEAEAKALIARAEAEAETRNDLEEKRRYELEWARLKVLEKLAASGRRFIAGDMGESILNQLVPIFGDDH